MWIVKQKIENKRNLFKKNKNKKSSFLIHKYRTGPWSVDRFKPEVYPRSKLTKWSEEENQEQLK